MTGLMSSVEKPAEKVGLSFSVMGVLGWILGVVFVLFAIGVAFWLYAKAKAKTAGITKKATGTTTAAGSNALDVAKASIDSLGF